MADAGERLFWTLCALLAWMEEESVGSIVFCDNSGTDRLPIDELRRIAEEEDTRLEFLLYDDNRLAGRRGKGAGEGDMIQRAIGESPLLKSSERFWKVTAKMHVGNFAHCASLHRQDEAVFKAPGWVGGYRFDAKGDGLLPACWRWCITRPRLWGRRVRRGFDPDRNVNTQFYKCSCSYYREVLWNAHLSVCDKRNYFLEHAFFARLAGQRYTKFRVAPDIGGRSGSVAGLLQDHYRKDIVDRAARLSGGRPPAGNTLSRTAGG
jgi:hypothetical protein